MTAPESHETMLLDEGDAYAVYGQKNSATGGSSRLVWAAMAALGVVAVVAVAVAASAHSSADGAKEKLRDQQLAAASLQSSVNTRTAFSGMMLMTQPVCRQSQHNYMQCLDLINTAENLIRDYANASYPTTEIETKVRMGDYNVGNSVAYLTREDSAIETMPDVLKKALASKDIDLTVGKLADLGQCEYVWANVGCLTMAEIHHSETCETNQNASDCLITVVPVIHIFSDASVDMTANGRARRASATSIAAVAGGIPDLRKYSEIADAGKDRRRGIGGPCGSGIGEMLMCHCRASGCGYLEYKRDPDCRWGC